MERDRNDRSRITVRQQFVDAVVRVCFHRAEHSRRSVISFSKTSARDDDDDDDDADDDGAAADDDGIVSDMEEEDTMMIII